MLKIITHVVGYVKTNCYIVWDNNEKDCVVIDPGDDAPGILRLLAEHGLTVRYIFLTHGHFDHILAVPALREATGAEVVIHKDDAGSLTDAALSLAPAALRKGFGQAARHLIADGAEFFAGGLVFYWLHTPGHTPGSCCIRCGNTLFTGDTLFHGDCGRCDLPGGDYGVMLRSLRRLYKIPGDYTVLPGHEEGTTLDEERRANGNMLEAVGRA